MYLLLVAIRLQMFDLIPNYPWWGNWSFLELHCLHFQAPQLFCPGWIPLSLEKEKCLYVYPLFHFYFVLKRIISLMKLKAFFIAETRMYFPITAFFNYTWTLNFKSQFTIFIASFLCCQSEEMNHETQKLTKRIKIHQSQTMTFWTFWSKLLFPKRSAKMIDSSKECKH